LSKGVEPTEEVMAPVKEEKPQALSTGKKGGRKPAAVKEEEENEEKKVEVSTRQLMSFVILLGPTVHHMPEQQHLFITSSLPLHCALRQHSPYM
jgi:hypothetical protein